MRLFNSFVASYLIRLRLGTHVTVALVSRLPAPYRPQDRSGVLEASGTLALASGRGASEEMPQHAEFQALIARLHGLTGADFEHVLTTFPLIPAEVRARAPLDFRNLH